MGRYEDLIAKAASPPPDVREERGATPEEATRDEVQTERDVDDSILTREGHKGREVDNPPVA